MSVDQQRAILFITGLALLGFVASPVWPIERDPWPFIIIIGGMIGVPVFVQRDRSNGKDDDAE